MLLTLNLHFSWYPTSRRQVLQIQPSDVIITNIRNNAQGVLEFVMYIQVAGGAQVLEVEVLESAVQVTMFFFCCFFFVSCPISSNSNYRDKELQAIKHQ